MLKRFININEYIKRSVTCKESQEYFSHDIIEDEWDMEYTNENHIAWLEARKELDNGETFSLEDLKTKYM